MCQFTTGSSYFKVPFPLRQIKILMKSLEIKGFSFPTEMLYMLQNTLIS